MLRSLLRFRLRSKRDGRRIYRAPNGRYYDPLAVRRLLELASEGRVNEWIEEQHSPEPLIALAADAKVLDAVRYVFSLPAVDTATGAGVTDREALDLFVDYQNWLWGKGGRG